MTMKPMVSREESVLCHDQQRYVQNNDIILGMVFDGKDIPREEKPVKLLSLMRWAFIGSK